VGLNVETKSNIHGRPPPRGGHNDPEHCRYVYVMLPQSRAEPRENGPDHAAGLMVINVDMVRVKAHGKATGTLWQ